MAQGMACNWLPGAPGTTTALVPLTLTSAGESASESSFAMMYRSCELGMMCVSGGACRSNVPCAAAAELLLGRAGALADAAGAEEVTCAELCACAWVVHRVAMARTANAGVQILDIVRS